MNDCPDISAESSEAADEPTLGHWKEFQASVDDLNAFVRPSVLRKYQLDILNSGKFSIVSPVSGNPVEVTRSVLAGDRDHRVGDQIAYLVPPDGWIVAGYVGKAFPLHEFVSVDGRVYTTSKVKTAAARLFKPREAAKLLEIGKQSLSSEADGRVTCVIGHANFAHHLWNELSALDAWLEQASAERREMLSILVIDEPLGPLREIFPALSAVEIAPVTREDLKSKLSGAPIAVRVGSRLVTQSVRKKILAFSKEQTSIPDSLRDLLDAAWPAVWVSVRLGSRTADNLDEFLLAFFRQVFDTYPNTAIVVDGFSFPHRFFEDPRTIPVRERFRSFENATAEFIANLRNRAAQLLGAEYASRVQSTSGLSLPGAIAMGGYCDYYVCHIGTLQHKVGWLHNIPGFLHGPHGNERNATWHGEQVEDGISPAVVAGDLVTASDVPAKRAGNWSLNYAFTDVQAVAASVIASMQASLGRPSAEKQVQRPPQESGQKITAIDPDTGGTTLAIDVPALAGTAFDGKHLYQIRDNRI